MRTFSKRMEGSVGAMESAHRGYGMKQEDEDPLHTTFSLDFI